MPPEGIKDRQSRTPGGRRQRSPREKEEGRSPESETQEGMPAEPMEEEGGDPQKGKHIDIRI
jgi:hypothetical protein